METQNLELLTRGLQATHKLGGLNVEVQKITNTKAQRNNTMGHEKKSKSEKEIELTTRELDKP